MRSKKVRKEEQNSKNEDKKLRNEDRKKETRKKIQYTVNLTWTNYQKSRKMLIAQTHTDFAQ